MVRYSERPLLKPVYAVSDTNQETRMRQVETRLRQVETRLEVRRGREGKGGHRSILSPSQIQVS